MNIPPQEDAKLAEFLRARQNQPAFSVRVENCIKEMQKRGLDPGRIFELRFFETVFMLDRAKNQAAFAFLMISVSFKLETVHGRVLTAASHQGRAWHLRLSREHSAVMQKRRGRLRNGLSRNCLLADATRKNELTDDEKRQLETEKNHSAYELMLLIRADQEAKKQIRI
jgi:hypothetical protein